jgi:hypothetical protein
MIENRLTSGQLHRCTPRILSSLLVVESVVRLDWQKMSESEHPV